MKLVFLSIIVFIYGFFCDIYLAVCEKSVNQRLEKGKPLTGKMLVFISNLAQNSLSRWQGIEKRLICLLAQEQNF